MDSKEVETVVEFVKANGEKVRLESYLQRGRGHAALSEEDLTALFVDSMRGWSSNVKDILARTQHNDANAEFEIRGLKAPYHLVKAEIDRLSAAIAALFEELDEDRKAAINAEMIAEYVEGQKRSN